MESKREMVNHQGLDEHSLLCIIVLTGEGLCVCLCVCVCVFSLSLFHLRPSDVFCSARLKWSVFLCVPRVCTELLSAFIPRKVSLSLSLSLLSSVSIALSLPLSFTFCLAFSLFSP